MKEVVRRLVPAAMMVAAPIPSMSRVIMAQTMKTGLEGMTSMKEKRNMPTARSRAPRAKEKTRPSEGKSQLARMSGERMKGTE